MEASIQALNTISEKLKSNGTSKYTAFSRFVESELLDIAKIHSPTAEKCKRDIQKLLLDAASFVADFNYEELTDT